MIRTTIFLLFLLAFASASHADPNEAKGIVTKIINGATFEVGDLGCVKLADVQSVPANSQAGLKAREFTRDNLAGTQVFLDIDDKTGRGPEGCWICVVYRAYPNGTPNLNANFNLIYANSGYGKISDDPETEFDPNDWG